MGGGDLPWVEGTYCGWRGPTVGGGDLLWVEWTYCGGWRGPTVGGGDLLWWVEGTYRGWRGPTVGGGDLLWVEGTYCELPLGVVQLQEKLVVVSEELQLVWLQGGGVVQSQQQGGGLPPLLLQPGGGLVTQRLQLLPRPSLGLDCHLSVKMYFRVVRWVLGYNMSLTCRVLGYGIYLTCSVSVRLWYISDL